MTRIEFPETRIQIDWDVALLYTTHEYELVVDSETETHNGCGTEIFVRRDGKWVNTGWQLDYASDDG